MFALDLETIFPRIQASISIHKTLIIFKLQKVFVTTVVRTSEGQNGGDAAAQHVLDRGPVPS